MSNPSPTTRAKVIERDGYRCRYCGVDVVDDGTVGPNMLTLDHVTPRTRGGKHGFYNLVVACRRCNSHKGATNVDPVTGDELVGQALADLLDIPLATARKLPGPREPRPTSQPTPKTKAKVRGRDERRHEWLHMPEHGTYRRWLHGCRCRSCGRARTAHEAAVAVPA